MFITTLASHRHVYLRSEGTTTQMDEPQCTSGSCAAGSAGATFVGASDDGDRVFFSTDDQLVDEDQDGGVDLYEREVPTGVVRRIGPGLSRFDAVSADGATVVAALTSALSTAPNAGGQAPVAGQPNLYVLRPDAQDAAERTVFVAGDVSGAIAPPPYGGMGPLSPNGRYLLLRTTQELAGPTGATLQDYLFDVTTRTARCLTCSTSGAQKPVLTTFGNNVVSHEPPVGPTDDGTVVFISPNPISVDDANAVWDAYLWERREGLHADIRAWSG